MLFFNFSEMTQENYFPYSSEVLYYQQEQFDYPVDTSLKVEVLKNRDALKNTRDKKADLSDLDENAWEAGSEVNRNVLVSKQEAEDLEAELEREKEDMYKVSCLVRVEAESEDELLKRVAEVKEFYRSYNMILECPLTDQMGFHEEFFPSTERYVSDYLQYVKGDFLAGLGFGATHMLGDGDGIYLGYDVLSYRSVYVKPWLAAQGVEGSITNALAKAFTGSLGGGKTMAMSLLSLHSCLFGAKGLIIDPKGDRKNWKRDLPMFGEHLNLIHITNAEENRGLFDPFVVMESDEDKKDLALSVLMFLCGYTTRDAGFALLTEHIDKVLAYPEGQPKGMLWIVEELYRTDTKESREMAAHIQAFANLGVTKLIFGDGQTQKNLTMDAVLNVILVENLTLPTMGTAVKEYRLEEILSVAVLLVISMYSLKFIHMQRDVFKFVDLDEAWSWLQVPEAKALSDKLVRAGRSMNAAINFATQNCDDLTDEKMKNNIGMKFAFRSTDREEIRKTLLFLGLEDTEGNAEVLRSLKNGECLMQDISGHIGIVYIDYVFQVFFRALDTRPPQEEEGEEPEYVAVEAQGKGAGL